MSKLEGTVRIGSSVAASAVVEVHNSAGDTLDQVVVDDQGRFTYHLSPGKWTLQAWDGQGHRAAIEVWLEEQDETVQLELREPEDRG
jgi:hypothetical protein